MANKQGFIATARPWKAVFNIRLNKKCRHRIKIMVGKSTVWLSFILSVYLFVIRVLYPMYGTKAWITSVFIPVSIIALISGIAGLSMSSRRTGIGLVALVIVHGFITVIFKQPMIFLFLPFEIFIITFSLAFLLLKKEHQRIIHRIFPSITIALSMFMYVTMVGDILCSGLF